MVVPLIVYGIVAFIVFDSQENLSCTWIDMYSRKVVAADGSRNPD